MACSKLCYDLEKLIHKTPLRALNFASVKILSNVLNIEGKLVELKDGSGLQVYDNFTGIAEQENFGPEEIKDLSDNPNPTNELINEMAEKHCTIGDLCRDLSNMGRDDLIKRSRANWVKDCNVFKENKGKLEEIPQTNVVFPVSLGQRNYLYDAFLSFAYADLSKAKKMIRKLENLGFRLFVPGRDDIPGGAKYELTAYNIEERCKHIIILLTKAFRKSPECEFHVKFSNALDPGATEMKIIPVICEDKAEVPTFLNFIHTCDITKNEWSSLYRALSHQRHGQNTRRLVNLTYPPPPNVVYDFRENKSEDRCQPEGASGVTTDVGSQGDSVYEVYV